MTREEAQSLAIQSVDKNKCTLLEMVTGFGKSKIAVDAVNHICDRVYRNYEDPTTVLILVAKRVHKQNWLDEINKWGGIKSDYITIECYESLKKYEGAHFDVVVLDEAHHIFTETRLSLLQSLTIEEALIGLSATLPKNLKEWFKYKYKTGIIQCSLQNAIDEEVLPEPTIYLMPLKFDNIVSEAIYKNPKGTIKISCSWAERWHYINKKNVNVRIFCTKRQYLDDLNSQIEYYKNKYMRSRNDFIKNKWLKLCGDRLKWLSDLKNNLILEVLKKFEKERTLVFCNSINQTEALGSNCIHSKNRAAEDVYLKFNSGELNHITSCNMLNEGMNLVNCRIGIYANINASETITKQRMGRLLRHPKPIVIIPYYEGTREAELVNKMIEEYDPRMIKTIENIKEIKL